MKQRCQKNHAECFLEKMMSDEVFRDAVIKIEDVEKKIKFLNRHGYTFTADELENAFSMLENTLYRALSNDNMSKHK